MARGDDLQPRPSGNDSSRAIFWGIIVSSAVITGFALSLLAGYLIGHYTGHTDTTTVRVTAAQQPATPGGADAKGAATPPTETQPAQTQPAETQPAPSLAAGRRIFLENCAPCHGMDGTGDGAPDLTASPVARNLSAVERQVTNGGGGMPAFRGQLSEQQIRQVAQYVTNVIAAR